MLSQGMEEEASNIIGKKEREFLVHVTVLRDRSASILQPSEIPMESRLWTVQGRETHRSPAPTKRRSIGYLDLMALWLLSSGLA